MAGDIIILPLLIQRWLMGFCCLRKHPCLCPAWYIGALLKTLSLTEKDFYLLFLIYKIQVSAKVPPDILAPFSKHTLLFSFTEKNFRFIYIISKYQQKICLINLTTPSLLSSRLPDFDSAHQWKGKSSVRTISQYHKTQHHRSCGTIIKQKARNQYSCRTSRFLINVFPDDEFFSERIDGLVRLSWDALVEILQKLGSCANTRLSDNSLLMATLK